jgi:ankyrin repeat protein
LAHGSKINNIEILQKLRDLAKELHLKPEELRNDLWLSKDNSGETAWHMAARKINHEVLEKL